MAYALTLSGATYGTGKFGQARTAGVGELTIPTSVSRTIECWIKSSTSATGMAYVIGAGDWNGDSGNGRWVARYPGPSGEVSISTSPIISDGAYHHIELNLSASGAKLFIDGALAGSSDQPHTPTSQRLQIGAVNGGAYIYQGDIEELAIWDSVRHTAAFTPPTAAYAGNEAGLVALFHFDGNSTDSASGAPAAPTTLPFTDNFDADTLGSVAPGWTVKSGTWVVGTDRPVSGARSFGTTTGADGDTAIYTGANPVADMGVQYDFIIDSLGRGFGAGVRFDSAYANGYLYLVYGVSGVIWYYKFKKVGNAFSAIGDATNTGIAAPNGTVVHVRATAIGSTISLFLAVGANALPTTPTATFTDTSVTAAGYPLLYRANNTAPASAGTIDNFRMDNGTAEIVEPPIPAGNNVLTSGTGNVLFSPYTWNVGASTAKTINAGAYFKTLFTSATCTLAFDMTGIASPVPQISYRIDGTGAWITAPIAASVALTLPSGTSGYANAGGHLLEVVVKSMTETQSRWSPQATAVNLIGIVVDAGATLTKPTALPLNAIFYGDSITEGVRTLNSTATNDTDRNDAAQGWACRAAQILGAEVGIVGFGATGFINSGSGSVPALPTSYNLLYSGVSRSFAVAPDFIVLMEGTNDGGDVTTPATTVLNGLIAATPATTKIVVLRPFNGTGHASQLQAAIAACTAPSRCAYVDTAGWFNTAHSADGLHPYGNANINRIGPLAADAIRSLIQISRGTRSARTVTLTLNDRNGNPRANLSGLKWAFFDQTTAGALTVNADSGAAATTNASGVLTLTVQTTLAPGATGWLVLSDSAGNAATASNAFSGPVTVA